MNNRHTLTICGATLAFLISPYVSPAWAQTSAGKATPLIVGQWKLNAEKSNVRLPPDSVEIRQYSLRPDGFLTGLLITVNAQGSHYLQFTAKSDGKDYPEYSDQLYGGYAKPRVNRHRALILRRQSTLRHGTIREAGKVIFQGKRTISKDGKTLTVTVDGGPSSQALVYDRQ